MPSIDALECAGLSVLARLARGNVVSMSGFARAAGLPPAASRRLRERLVHLGLVRVERRAQGSVMLAHIELTPLGERVAEMVARIEEEMAGAK